MIRTFGAIGDIHAEDTFLAAALERLQQEGAEAILAVGDVVDGRGDLDICVRLLARHRVLAVRGNHERWLLDGTMRQLPNAHLREDLDPATLSFLAGLPVTRTLDTVAGKLLLCHGVGDDDMVRLLPDDEPPALAGNEPFQRVLGSGAEVMVCGHTHRPMVRTLFGLLVINAGTLHYADAPSFVHVDLARKLARTFVLDLTPEGEVRVHEAEAIRFGAPGDDVWGAGW